MYKCDLCMYIVYIPGLIWKMLVISRKLLSIMITAIVRMVGKPHPATCSSIFFSICLFLFGPVIGLLFIWNFFLQTDLIKIYQVWNKTCSSFLSSVESEFWRSNENTISWDIILRCDFHLKLLLKKALE